MSQPPAPDDPARWSGSPGQREPTQQFTPTGQQQPGPYAQPGQQQGQYAQPGQQQGQYAQPGQYPQQQGQYPQPGGYPPAGGYPQPGAPAGAPWVQGGAGVPPPQKGGNGTAIVLVVVGVLLVVGLAAGLFFGLRGRDGASDASSATAAGGDATSEAPAGESADGLPPATSEPTGLGDDPAMDALAEECFDGTMQSCDDLFMRSPGGSAYEDYGDTCAGRQPDGGPFCTTTFPG